MVIIIEGPDGAGKTVLAKQLCSKYNLDYHHEGPPPRHVDALEYYGSILNTAERTVFDRLALGERIYGPMLRGKDGLGGDNGWRIFNRLVKARCAYQIMCIPPFFSALANWNSGRIELFKDKALFETSYKGFLALSHTADHVYNYLEPNGLKILHTMLEAHDRDTVSLPDRYIGNPAGRYLFVGHQGSNPGALHALPFFSTKNSSGYLWQALDLAGYEDDEYAVVNAYSHNWQNPVRLLRFEKVIALGNAASHLCDEQEVPHVKIPHPQFWKRFNHGIENYAQLLREQR